MGNVVWTPAQRDAIFSHGRSIAVSAAAGSGKTAVLTRRIIERVCAPDGSGDLSRILVVTFTKAAASELVSRISDALADELAEHPENRHLHSQSLLVSSAHISTIHSFCLELIRTNFQKLSVPADFSAADETEITLMMKRIADELISVMKENGAYQITLEQADRLAEIVLVEAKNPKTGIVKKVVSRECVGRDAAVLLKKIGVNVGPEIRCIICETAFEHPFVQNELMMPILPIVRVSDIDEAIDLAVKAEHGCRHTAHMHSKNIDHLTRFARAVETTIFVKNAPSYAGIGFGGEGHTTFTIAGPTGEGLTSARSFTRYRRCVMADSFRII